MRRWGARSRTDGDRRKAVARQGREITEVLTAARRRSPLAVLLDAESVEQIWDDELTMGQKRAILAEVFVVTILPPSRVVAHPTGPTSTARRSTSS